jgi:hypothetical protein
MPRLGGGGVGQSYLVGYASGEQDSNNNSATTSTPTPSNYNYNRTFSEGYTEEAPSSAHRLPPVSSSSSFHHHFHQQSLPPIPAPPSSMKSSKSLFSSRTGSGLLSPGVSPRRTYASDKDLPTVQSDSAPRQPHRAILRAAEAGKGTLLPDFNPVSSSAVKKVQIEREPPNRTKTRSSPSLKLVMNLPGRGGKHNSQSHQSLPQTHQDTQPKLSVLQAAKQTIRRRTTSCPSDDEDYYTRASSVGGGGGRSSDNESASPYRPDRREGRRGSRRSPGSFFQKLSRMKLGNFLQVVIVIAVTALVWESHHKALFAAQQLSQFKEEESLLLLHLQKIEQQSIQLHENLSRLAESGVKTNSNNNNSNKDVGNGVDFDLIHKQTQQLYQMEEELNHEVRTLQTRIQQSARKHIIQEFGEGPVQVIFELDFGISNDEGARQISILLWHDTPHAAWTWLEQIGRHVWDGSEFSWEQGHVVNASPHREDPIGGKMEFVEQSQHGHEAWTVGLRDNDAGALSMYINLSDNTNLHKHETCVGKVIGGFDALQRLLEASRHRKYDSDASIQIQTAMAMHVTKKEGPGN